MFVRALALDGSVYFYPGRLPAPRPDNPPGTFRPASYADIFRVPVVAHWHDNLGNICTGNFLSLANADNCLTGRQYFAQPATWQNN